jgi:prepilin-type N-terminal cleavage/methylation domain-containing protein
MKRGLTLLEVLISMMIMSVLVTAIGYAVSSSLKVGQENRRNQDAVEVAQAIVERYRTHWRDDRPYACKEVPNVASLLGKLPGYTVNINIAAAFKPDGTAAPEPDCSTTPYTGDPPPLRQIVVTISQGARVRAQLETKIGDPSP